MRRTVVNIRKQVWALWHSRNYTYVSHEHYTWLKKRRWINMYTSITPPLPWTQTRPNVMSMLCKHHLFYQIRLSGTVCARKIKASLKIGHFIVVCSVTWPVFAKEAKGNNVSIQTPLLCSLKCELVSIRIIWFTQQKRSHPASLAFKGF